MKTGTTANRAARVVAICALLISLMLACAAAGYAETPLELSIENVRIMSKCDAVFDGNKITLTDEEFNEDVWSSKILIESGIQFTPGVPYTISFEMTGDFGVGEFFLCKAENIDERYDETFTSESGNKTFTFTPVSNEVFIGMQMGNLGYGRSMTCAITNLSKLADSENPALLRA